MIGVQAIGQYLPVSKINNYDIHDDLEIIKKLGIESRTQKGDSESVLDMCLSAYEDLVRTVDFDKSEINLVVLVTQNPDINIPHTTSMIHGALDLPESCACFDVSLGCSGYVYALSIVKSFMESNKIGRALLFTCDPYSKVIDKDDKGTKLIFGDAASVSLISNLENDIKFSIEKFTFGTHGKKGNSLTVVDEKLFMDGRSIFNFVATKVPGDIKKCLELNMISFESVDYFIFHPGSKYMIDTLIRRMKLDPEKVPFMISDYGNTVSSSIPLMLIHFLDKPGVKQVVLSGFGVGLSWASCVIKVNKN